MSAAAPDGGQARGGRTWQTRRRPAGASARRGVGAGAPPPRRCTGSRRCGIEPHDAPVADFPRQPSQKDGLGRMCKTHWNEYTAGLARDAKARKAAEAAQPDADASAVVEAVDAQPQAKRPRAARREQPRSPEEAA